MFHVKHNKSINERLKVKVMRVLVNGEMKELEAIGVNGIDWTEELLGQHSVGEFHWNDETETYETDENSFEWWKEMVEKLNHMQELENDLTDVEKERYFYEMSDADMSLEDDTNRRVTWLEEKRLVVKVENEERVIKVGDLVELQDIFESDSDDQFVEELVESGCLSPDNENIIEFKVIRRYSSVWSTDLEITDIY